ncbi:FdtA/QdtA family cupin domain-containing protein [Ekhidna sp.]|uniref:sugar 3,4-ketoisomerase n=1 Tax=Ekhidna sp. TaxID=2608089 RepID=UPI003299D7FD
MLPNLIKFEKIGFSHTGYISVAEVSKNIDFEIKRVYWTYFTPNHIERGNHAHKKLEQLIFAVNGKIDFNLEDSNGNKHKFTLDAPHIGLYIPPGYWRTIRFSHNAVLLCLASEAYDENDYIRDYNDFLDN